MPQMSGADGGNGREGFLDLAFTFIDRMKYRAVVEEAKKIHSVAWYVSMMTDDYIAQLSQARLLQF